MGERFVIWGGIEGLPLEAARIDLGADSVRATGTQIGSDPLPYRVDYELEVGPGWLGTRFEARATGDGWARALDLRGDRDGSWSADVEASGAAGLPVPGGDTDAFRGALDVDLALSPLTNLMPVKRHRLAEEPGRRDFVMAWVAVPELSVIAYPQRYEHVGPRPGGGSVVRFVDLQPGEDFVADLSYDADGIVEDYPGLAARL